MIYSSNIFFVLLPLFIAIYYNIPNATGQRLYLLVISLLFIAYAGSVHFFVFIAVLVIGMIYFTLPYHKRSKPIVYGITIALFLLILINFKYSIFLSNISGLPLTILSSGFAIPLGISFYTFTIIGAVYDRRKLQENTSPSRLALFIAFFPALVAGPIVRYRQLGPHFDSHKEFSRRNIAIGTHLFIVGYVKKVLIADPIATAIDPIWAEYYNPVFPRWSRTLTT